MRDLISAAADLLLGATCPGCDEPGLWLCPPCLEHVAGPPADIDRGLPVPLVAAAPYRPVLAKAIPRFKDDGALHLDGMLGRLLARAVAELDRSPEACLVPVPSLRRSIRTRGYDHGMRLARVAGRRCGLKVSRSLVRLDRGLDQRGLGKSARQANLVGTMRCDSAPPTVILVDDVVTTGASLREAIRALTAAGSRVLGAAVIGNADRC